MKAFERTFDTESAWELTLDAALGGHAYELSMHERLRFRFSSKKGRPSRVRLQLKSAKLHFDPFGILLPGDRWLFVDSMELTKKDFDLGNCRGTLDLRTGALSLTTAIVLRPSRFALLEQFGLDQPLRLRIAESGRMDIEHRRMPTITEPFTLGEGALAAIRLRGAKPPAVTGSCVLAMGPLGFLCKQGSCTGTCVLEELRGGSWVPVPSPVPRRSGQLPLRCSCV